MPNDYFICLCFEENSIQAAIWNIKNGEVNVISTSTSVTYEDDETLVSATDEVLSSSIQNLPDTAQEPSKTVFGVPSFWVEDGQIKREHLDKIRHICSKLSLNPVGFVVLPEAIAHFQKEEVGTPLTAILIGIYSQSIDVSLFKLGNLAGTVNVARSVSIADDVIEGLARFDLRDNLPSAFLLYDSMSHDLEEVKQELIKADWNSLNEKVRFLHTPSVDTLTSDSKMAALCLAAGAEIAGLSKINYGKPHPVKEPTNLQNIPQEFEDFVDPQNLGFSTNGEIMPRKETPKFNKMKLPKVKFRIPKENLIFMSLIIFFILTILGMASFVFLSKAQVTIIVSPVSLDTKKTVHFDTKASSVDASKLIVPVKEVSVDASADKTKSATGTKVIGTPAKGGVTFYNVGDAVTLAAGTILTSSNLQFALDSDVQIASGSAASISTAKGNITSSGLGADYNLGSGTILSVANYSQSSIQAKSDSDLTGGSSQEVTAVAKSDIASLTSDLTSQLTQNGKDQLKQNLPAGYILIDNTLNANVTDTTPDHDVNEAATSVKLTETATVKALTVKKDDMNTIATALFKDQVKPGLILDENQLDYLFERNDVDFKANLLPSINNTSLAVKIAGKNTSAARQALSSIPGYVDATFDMKPNISFLQILPFMSKNITISLSSNK